MVVAAARHKGKTDVELLERLPFLSLSPASGVGQLTDAELKRRGIATRLAMQLDSTVSVIQIISPHGDMTPGMMIAVTMILGRALQPVEMGISQARNMIDAVSAYKVVEATLQVAVGELRSRRGLLRG